MENNMEGIVESEVLTGEVIESTMEATGGPSILKPLGAGLLLAGGIYVTVKWGVKCVKKGFAFAKEKYEKHVEERAKKRADKNNQEESEKED